MNEIQLTTVGNLTSDPELRFTSGGVAVASFTVATTPRFFDKQSNTYKDGEAVFLRCSAWRELGEHAAASLAKGHRVIVSGALQQRSYETKEGEKRTAFELKVEAVGPELRYATAQVTRAAGDTAPQEAAVWPAEAEAIPF